MTLLMRFPRPVTSWLGLGIISLAVVCSSLSAAELQHQFWSYQHDGVTYFAVGLRGDAGSEQPDAAKSHWLVVDTSASQTGEYRSRTLQAVRSFVESLPKGDQVRISTVDTQLGSLVNDYASPRDEKVTSALKQLSRRVPLGATNLEQAFGELLGNTEVREKSNIVYFGDGISAAAALQSKDVKAITETARNRGISIHGYLIGPRVDLQLTGILALQTGGTIQLDADTASELGFTGVEATHAGKLLAEASQVGIQDGGAINSNDPAMKLASTSVPPIRSDRETIIFGKTASSSVELLWNREKNSQVLKFEVASQPENAFVKTVWERSEKDQGLSIPFAGSHLMNMARAAHENRADSLATIAKGAAESKKVPQARQALNALRKMAPDHKEIPALIRLVSRQTSEQGVAATDDAAKETDDVSAPRPGSIIEAEEERRRVAAQKMQHESSEAIDQARKGIKTDPDAALDLIKRQLSTVLSSTDINPEIREDLRKNLSAVWGELASRRDVLVAEQADAQRRLATAEANRRLNDQMVLEDQRMKQLIDRVRSLLDEGARGDANAFEEAEAVSRSALLMRPHLKEPTAALFVSEAAGQLDKSFRLRNLRQDRFLETLHQVELSHVPFPDEPPIVYPPAEIWRQIYDERVVRRDWANVDLKKYSRRELEIKAKLDSTLDFPFDVQQETLQGVIDLLKIRLNIDILPDTKALEELGVAMDTPQFDLSISNVKVKTLLKLLLKPVELTYVVEDEVLKITTQTEALKKRFIRVYYVGDLVIPIQTPTGGGGLGGGGGIGGGGLGG
ncbi:MAG: VWA domain-containing protein, partial [Planctomycetaceae bacterium]|nr:VWA domain-containing protein [Planctomycetaceae bacterium]